MNVFTFTGNLGRDAEVKTVGQHTLCEFSVAVKSGFGDREQTMWVRCNMWGQRAESKLVQWLTKGKGVAVTGELSMREYDKKDGTRGYSLEVRVVDVTLTGSDNGSHAQPQARAAQQQRAPKQTQQPTPGGFDSFDADVPF